MNSSTPSYDQLPWDMYLLTLDDYSPHALVGGVSGGRELAHWQYAVEATYRCLKSGLWTMVYSGVLDEIGAGSYEGLCAGLARLSPADLNDEGAAYWLKPFMMATDAGRQIVGRYRVDGLDQAQSEMMSEIDRAFSVAGVSFERGLLFPIAL